jgi:hypothetical protein
MIVNKYLVLHSGDRILMSANLFVADIHYSQKFFNGNIKTELKSYKPDVQQTADYIELIMVHQDRRF